MRKVARLTIIAFAIVVGLAGLLIANFFLALRILRVDYPPDPILAISDTMAPAATPLVFVADGFGNDKDVLERFERSAGIPAHIRNSLPNTHPCLAPIEYVGRANPYPPLQAQVHGSQLGYFTYGYIGVDARYHQITYYGGEADTTPSFLVAKVRGRETGWGDYFVRYTVHLSNDSDDKPVTWDITTGMPISWQPKCTNPQIDRIDWSTYEGGSSNGFEEIIFALVATVGEVGIALTLWFLLRRRRRAAV